MQFLRFNAFKIKTPLKSLAVMSKIHFQSRRKDVIPGIGARFHLSSVADLADFECDILHDDGKETDKHNALCSALSQISGGCGKESMLSLERFFCSRNAHVISTGSLKLDLALGIGGLPKGRFIEIYGKEASGKTTLALHIIREAQKLGGYCAYLDVENALDLPLLESIGVDSENLLFAHPNSGENLLSMVDTLTKSGSVDVIIVDSVAALVPQREIDEPTFVLTMDRHSLMMTQALRKINYSLSHSNTLVVFLNQTRSKSKQFQGFGSAGEYTCGGNALKFYAAVRLRLARKKLIVVDDKVIGLGICVQVVKNKLSPAMKTAELALQFGKGICTESGVFELACEHGIVFQKKSCYYSVEDESFDNRQDAERYLIENDDVFNRIVARLRIRLFPSKRFAKARDRVFVSNFM